MSKTIEFQAEVTNSESQWELGRWKGSVLTLEVRHPTETYVGGPYNFIMTPAEPGPRPFVPPWDDAPAWAEWAARNKSCVERWYERRPKPGSDKSPWWTLWDGRSDLLRNWHEGQEDHNWRDTLQARPKPERIPSWEHAPNWAMWLAQTINGTWIWHAREPVAAAGYWSTRGNAKASFQTFPNPKWRDTLQRRTEPELNRCPRCDGDVYVLEGTRRSDWWTVQCKACGMTGPIETTRALAIAAHNVRKNPEIDDCPFCGGGWNILRDDIQDDQWFYATCTGCQHSSKWHRTLMELVAALNRRDC